jgi:enoyl-CoA hydratase/carnithine racemase
MFRLERSGGIARVVIDRAAKRNAVGLRDWAGLAETVAAIGEGDRVVAIVSAHPGMFCAGADIADMTALADDMAARARFREEMGAALDAIRALPVPAVAVVDGGCFGAGVALALACDIRVASPRARFAVPPARLGIAYPQPDIDALVRTVGRAQSARLLFGAETIDAHEARRIGLIETIEEDGGDAFLARIAAAAPSSLRALKAGLNRRPGGDARFEGSFGSADFAEGLAAFAARRDPVFA